VILGPRTRAGLTKISSRVTGKAAGNPQRMSGAALTPRDGLIPKLRQMFTANVLGAVIDLNGTPDYVHSGWFLISDANLIVIGLMIAVLVLAILLPFPGSRNKN
jgi:hypothetical protein